MDELKNLEDILKPTIVHVGGEKVILDSRKMEFNEQTLDQYLEVEGQWYSYYGEQLAIAEYIHQRTETEYDVKYSEKFKSFKEGGCSDKLAEASAKSDPEVEENKKSVLRTKHVVRKLQQHLRAWDKNHDNAQSRGHMLRKEMDKLNRDIYFSKADAEEKVKDIIG